MSLSPNENVRETEYTTFAVYIEGGQRNLYRIHGVIRQEKVNGVINMTNHETREFVRRLPPS